MSDNGSSPPSVRIDGEIRTHCYTSAWIRFCEHAMLREFTDMESKYAHCPVCDKTWNTYSLKEVHAEAVL